MDKVSYALGLGIGSQLTSMGAESLNIDDFAQAIKDSIAGKPALKPAEAQKIVQEFFAEQEKAQRAKAAENGAKAKAEGEKYLEENAKKEGVQVTASGLQYKVITEGTGPKPTATQEVSVKYEGKLVDGTVFDSSYERKDPVTKFRANQVIKGWTEALTMMPMGSKWELYIPYNLAYGEREQGKIKPYSALIFTVELIGITGVEAPKAEPETVPAAKLTPAKKATKSTKRTK